MPRARSGVVRKKRVKKVLERTKGFRASGSKLFKTAKNRMIKALTHAYVGRKQKKRNFRQLWIARINAECRNSGITYSLFINGLKKLNIDINRKNLANLAVNDLATFQQLVEKVKAGS